MNESQLLKGILEGCILGIISKGETYGYQIIQDLKSYGFDNVGEGTLYPLLTRLDKKNYIHYRKEKSALGPIRKYYSISEEGLIYYRAFKDNYKTLIHKANQILFEEDQYDLSFEYQEDLKKSFLNTP